jgi:hypothetical protein
MNLSTSRNCRSENIRVVPIVISELKFRDVERHIFCAHLVERADHATLEDRPEAFNCVGVNRADNVLLAMVVNGSVRIFLAEFPVSIPSIGCEQANFVGTDLVHKLNRGFAGSRFPERA